MTPTQKNCVTGLAALLIIIIFGVIIFTLWRQQQRQQLVDAFGEDLLNLCNPPGGGLTNPANWPHKPGHAMKLLLLEQGTSNLHEWHDELPDDLRADERDQVDLVVCMGGTGEEILRTCEYYWTDTGFEPLLFTVELARPVMHLTIINGQTQLRIVEKPLGGYAPTECPDRQVARYGSTVLKVGEDITQDGFVRAIRSYLALR